MTSTPLPQAQNSPQHLRVLRRWRFHAAHRVECLRGHKCARTHGHTYRVVAEIAGPLDGRGMVVMSDEADAAWAPLAEKLDHATLNDTLGPNATVETLAVYLYGQLTVHLPPRLTLKRIEVWETDSLGAVYVA